MPVCVFCGQEIDSEGCTWIERNGEREWMHVIWEWKRRNFAAQG